MKLKAKPILITFTGLLLTGALVSYFLCDAEPLRIPASVPNNYESMLACEKQDVLWDKIQASAYKELPEYQKFGIPQIWGMGKQEIAIKGNYHSDFAPAGWKKFLHRRGALAKIKVVPVAGQFTGVFQGADCGLLRLSLTYKTTDSRPVAPGLALKILRDKTFSANISALVSLDGQGKEFNFFKFPMSNIVPIGEGFGQKIVHKIFSKASHYPEELLLNDMASTDSHGVTIKESVSPRQLFFKSGPGLAFSSSEHDVREDFLSIPEGTVVYKVYALSEKHLKFDYSTYTAIKASKFLKEAQHIADIVTTSEFIASDFGDDGIFFKHQLRP